MLFDFERFTKLFARAYPVAVYGRHKQYCGRDCGLYSYDDALAVFKEYFLTYEYYMGTAHPQLKRERIVELIQRMDMGETPEECRYNGIDFVPADYPAMIATHFRTRYRNCDYNICHFFSGSIRYLRFCESVLTDGV